MGNLGTDGLHDLPKVIALVKLIIELVGLAPESVPNYHAINDRARKLAL